MPSSAWRSTLFPYTTLFRSDRKSTRLNSSHSQISYAVFCLKKKNTHLRSDRKSTRLNYSHSQISYAVFCLKKKDPNTLRSKAAARVNDKYHSLRIPGTERD